jgi:hypothetical protein
MAFSTPVRLLILIAVALVAYCFWPRTPSLTTFDPKKMAPRYEAIWRDTAKKSFSSVYWQEYFHHERDYHIPPVESLNMAGNITRALSLLQSPSADDRGQANTILNEYFIRLRDVMKLNFEASEVALQDAIWQSEPAADEARTTDPVDALAVVLSQLYGGDRNHYTDAAVAIVDARKMVVEAADADSQKKASEATLAAVQLLQVAIMNKGEGVAADTTTAQ